MSLFGLYIFRLGYARPHSICTRLRIRRLSVNFFLNKNLICACTNFDYDSMIGTLVERILMKKLLIIIMLTFCGGLTACEMSSSGTPTVNSGGGGGGC